MQTRSQSKRNSDIGISVDIGVINDHIVLDIFEVNIDFNDASLAWRANKRSIGGGCYTYKCPHVGNKNRKCRNEPIPSQEYCNKHND
jgi:hypothetical protein